MLRTGCPWRHLPHDLPPWGTVWSCFRQGRDHRQIPNGILWKLRTGAPWRDMPDRFGPWRAVYARFVRWQRDGTWDWVLVSVQTKADAVGEMVPPLGSDCSPWELMTITLATVPGKRIGG